MSAERTALIMWLNQHKTFTSDGHDYQHLIDAWTECFFGRYGQEHPEQAEQLAKKQRQFYERQYDAVMSLLANKPTKSNNVEYFVTIGFNHQTWNVPACVSAIQKVLNASWVKDGEAVFELYRSNGEHLHAHFSLILKDPLPKSKVVEKLFKLAGMKNIVLKKNFIDIKELTDVRRLYIRGIKQDNKIPFVVRDQEWRGKNNIPNLFKTNQLLEE